MWKTLGKPRSLHMSQRLFSLPRDLHSKPMPSAQYKALVRHATLADYPSIMKIDVSAQYGKLDYLPKMFFHFIESPHYRNYVCELDGEVIGYESVLIHDEGATLQPKAVRVKAGLRKKGFGRLMEDFMLNDFRDLPCVQSVIGVRNVPLCGPKESRVVARYNIYDATTDAAEQISSSPASAQFPVFKLSQNNIASLFTCPSACRMLFPNDIFYIGDIVLGILQGNVDFISDKDFVFASFKSPQNFQSSDSHQMYTFKDIAFLSIASELPILRENECLYVLSVYGNAFSHFQSHIQKHFSLIRTKQGLVTLRVVTEDTFPVDIVCNVLKPRFEQLDIYASRTFRKPFL